MGNLINKLKTVLTHPRSKLLAIMISINTPIGLLLVWLGYNSLVTSFLVGLASYVFAEWVISTKSQREARLQQITFFFRQHWWSSTKVATNGTP